MLFKIVSYYISLSLVLWVIAFLLTDSWRAMPFALVASLVWMGNDELKKTTLRWWGMFLHALFLTVCITIIALLLTDEWITILPLIFGGSVLYTIDIKIRQTGSKRDRLIVNILGYVLLAGVLIYWYHAKGINAGLVGFTAGLVVRSISDFKSRNNKTGSLPGTETISKA